MGTGQRESAELNSPKPTGVFFKKIIVRMDIPHNFYDDNGIFHCNLIDFLLEESRSFLILLLTKKQHKKSMPTAPLLAHVDARR
jgi:hypothetical protein